MASSPKEKKQEEEFVETLLANQSLLFLLVLANHCTSDRGLKNPYREALFSFTNSQGEWIARGVCLNIISQSELLISVGAGKFITKSCPCKIQRFFLM